MDALDFDPERDRLFAVGDLVNRGPHSHEAIDWLERAPPTGAGPGDAIGPGTGGEATPGPFHPDFHPMAPLYDGTS